MRLLFLLFLFACSPDYKDFPKIHQVYCQKLATIVNGSFSFTPNGEVPCTIFVEKASFYYYTDDRLQGVIQGIELSNNRPLLKNLYKCLEESKYEEKHSFDDKYLVYEKCRKKVGIIEL